MKNINNKFYAVFSFFVAFFIFANNAYAATCYIVSGAGTTAYNGTYTDTGNVVNTKTEYSNGSKYLYVNHCWGSQYYWNLDSSVQGQPDFSCAPPYYFGGSGAWTTTGAIQTPDTGSWSWQSPGSPPAPTVTASTCGGGVGGTTTPISNVLFISAASSTATGTIEYTFTASGANLINNIVTQITLGILLIITLLIALISFKIFKK